MKNGPKNVIWVKKKKKEQKNKTETLKFDHMNLSLSHKQPRMDFFASKNNSLSNCFQLLFCNHTTDETM